MTQIQRLHLWAWSISSHITMVDGETCECAKWSYHCVNIICLGKWWEDVCISFRCKEVSKHDILDPLSQSQLLGRSADLTRVCGKSPNYVSVVDFKMVWRRDENARSQSILPSPSNCYSLWSILDFFQRRQESPFYINQWPQSLICGIKLMSLF